MALPTLAMLDGFEHARAVASTTEFREPYYAIQGASFVTSPVRSGSRALELTCSTSQCQVAYADGFTGVSQLAISFYVRFASLPASSVNIAEFETSYVVMAVEFRGATSKLRLKSGANNSADVEVTIGTGVWYRVTAELDSSASTYVAKLKVDEATEVTLNVSTVADGQDLVRLGTTTNATYTAYYDDVLVADGDGQYELLLALGSHSVVSLVPTADGTHNIGGGLGGWTDELGNNLSGSTTDSYEHVDELPGATETTQIRHLDTRTTDYMEHVFAALPSGSDVPIDVRGYTSIVHSGAGTDNCRVLHYETESSTSTDIKESTDSDGGQIMVWSRKHTRPTGGWTRSKVNSLRSRMGYSNGNPDFYCHSTFAEVALTTQRQLLVVGPIGVR